jgi:SOS-response transcriptional repressor LexA
MDALHHSMNEMSTSSDERAEVQSPRMSLKLVRIARLKQFALHRGLEGPVAIGLAIGKKPNQASDLLSGKASFGEKVARSIEEFAQLPAGWLDRLNGDENIVAGPAVRGAVPLISNVQAGMYTAFVDNFHPGDGGQELIHTAVPIHQHTFALRVTGDSMEPEFAEGAILIIEPEMDPLPGDFVIAKNGDEETTFKQLVKDGADWYLKPLNPRYPIKPLGDSKIIGVLRAVEKRYR